MNLRERYETPPHPELETWPYFLWRVLLWLFDGIPILFGCALIFAIGALGAALFLVQGAPIWLAVIAFFPSAFFGHELVSLFWTRK